MFSNKIPTVLFLAGSLLCMGVSSQVFAQSNGSLMAQGSEKAREGDNAAVVDINSATLDELLQLKGIGKKKAEAVLADRERNGKFNRVEDLMRVKGFSEKQVLRVLAQNQGKILAGK